jgi:hypothetical protein
MMEGVGSIRNIGAAAIGALAFAGSGSSRISLPVRPAFAVYASFKHIRAIPDAGLKDGIPMYKLAILDNLIERLSGSAPAALGARSEVNARTIDHLITGLAAELRSRNAAGFRGGMLPDMGLVVDLVA